MASGTCRWGGATARLRKRTAGQLLPSPLHGENIRHGVAQVGDRRTRLIQRCARELAGKQQQARGVGLVGSLAHGDQRGLAQPQPCLQHVAAGRGLRTAHEAPGHVGPGQRSKEIRFHQQRFAADEPLPQTGIPLGVATEVEAAKHVHQGFEGWERGMT